MAVSRETSRGEFESASLAQLTRVGRKAVHLSRLLNEGLDGEIERKEAEFNELKRKLQASAISNPELPLVDKMAWFMALDAAKTSSKPAEIKNSAADLSARYKDTYAVLRQPNQLVMGFDIHEEDQEPMPLFLTSGMGLGLEISGTGEDATPKLYTTGTTADGEMKPIRLNFWAASHVVTTPERAAELREARLWQDMRPPRLVVGKEAIAATLVLNSQGGFPLYAWKQARELGVRLEELHPELKLRYDDYRDSLVNGLASNIYSSRVNDLENLTPHSINRMRNDFADAVFLGATKADLESAVRAKEAEVRDRNNRLLAFVSSAEQDEVNQN